MIRQQKYNQRIARSFRKQKAEALKTKQAESNIAAQYEMEFGQEQMVESPKENQTQTK